MALHPEDLADLVELTQNREHRGTWADISLDNQRYTVSERFLKGRKVPVKGGVKLSWKLQVNNTGTAQYIGLFHQDQTNVRNLAIGASQEWSMSTVNFSYDTNEEAFQGDSETEIVSEVLMREHSMYNDWFELAESSFWTGPASSTVDPRPLFGIPHWIQKNATEGFTGGDPSGFSAGAGNVSTGTYSAWKNYAFPYAGFTRDDLVKKWKRACEFTYFMAPHDHNELGGGRPDQEFYTTYRVKDNLDTYLDARNDNHKDVAGTGGGSGETTFKGVPVVWIPELENTTATGYDASDPIYGVNWNTFKFYFARGREMVRQAPKQVDGQHNVWRVHMDATCQLACLNRRSNFVGYVV